MNAHDCRRLLATCVPALPLRDVRYLAEGWDSTVFEVNGDLVFRFPKHADAALTLDREARLLPELVPALPVPVPQFLYFVHDCPRVAYPFAGYHKVPGEQLAGVTLAGSALAGLAAGLGAFLTALHSFPPSRAAALGITPAYVAGGPAAWHRWREWCDARAGALLTASERTRMASWFARAERDGVLAFTPALTHSDLGDEHILVDRASGALTGVIDFGDAGIGDPAIDFTGLRRYIGESFAEAVLAAYRRPHDDALLRRAALYEQLIPLHEVHYGLEIGDPTHIERGLAALRAGMLA